MNSHAKELPPGPDLHAYGSGVKALALAIIHLGVFDMRRVKVTGALKDHKVPRRARVVKDAKWALVAPLGEGLETAEDVLELDAFFRHGGFLGELVGLLDDGSGHPLSVERLRRAANYA